MQRSSLPPPSALLDRPPMLRSGRRSFFAPREDDVVEAQSQQQQSRAEVALPRTSVVEPPSTSPPSTHPPRSSSTTALISGLAVFPTRTNNNIIVPDYAMMHMAAGSRPADQETSFVRPAADQRLIGNDMGLGGFQLQNVHMRASSDEVNAARRRLMANMAETELARKVKAVVEAAPQGSLAEQENTQGEEGSVSTPCKKGTSLSKKGKEKMSLKEMSDYNRQRQSVLPLRPQEATVASTEILSNDAAVPLDDPFTTGLTSDDLKPYEPLTTTPTTSPTATLTNLPEPAAVSFHASSSGSTINLAGDEPSNYMVSPSKLPVDPPSFMDVCTSTFINEDRTPNGDKVHRPPLELGRAQLTEQWGRKVFPKRKRQRTPPETLLNTPPGRILKPGQVNDLYDPEDAGKYGDFHKPRNLSPGMGLKGADHPDGASDASVTLSYEWDSAYENEGLRRVEQRRFVLHTKANRNHKVEYFQRKLDGFVATNALEVPGPPSLAGSEGDEAEQNVPTGVPLKLTEPSGSIDPCQWPSWSFEAEPSGSIDSHQWPSWSFGSTRVRAASQGSPQSGSRSEPGIHVSRIPALLNHEEDEVDALEAEGHASFSFRSQRPVQPAQRPNPRYTPAYYRALIAELKRPLPPFKNGMYLFRGENRIDSDSDESIQREEAEMRASLTAEREAQQAREEEGREEESGKGSVEDTGEGSVEDVGEGSVGESAGPRGSGDSGHMSDAADQGEEEQGKEEVESSAPSSPEYRDLPRRVNGVAQRLLTDSFLKAEAAKRRGGSDGSVSRSGSPLEAPISIVKAGRAKSVTPEPETVPGMGTWRDGRSRHGFPPPEKRSQTSEEDAGSVAGSEGSTGWAGTIQDVRGSGELQTPPRRGILAEEEVVSSPEAIKNTTIPMIDPKREGGQRSPDSPAMYFDLNYDLPRRGQGSSEEAITGDGSPVSRRRTTGRRSEDVAELLARHRAKVESPAGQRGGVDNSRHDQALQRSLSILQQLRHGSTEGDATLDIRNERFNFASLSRSASTSGRQVPADRGEATDREASEASPGGSGDVSQEVPSRLSEVETEVMPMGRDDPVGRSWVPTAPNMSGPRPIAHGPDVYPNFPAYSSDLAARLEEVFGGDSEDSGAASAASEGRAGPSITADQSRSVEYPEDNTQQSNVLTPVASGFVSGKEDASLLGSEQGRPRSTHSSTPATGRVSRRTRQVHSSPKSIKSGRSVSVVGRTVGSETVPEGLPTAEDFEAGLFPSGSQADIEDLGQGEISPDDSSADEGESAAFEDDHSLQELQQVEAEPVAAQEGMTSSPSLDNMANSTATMSDSGSQAYSGHIPHGLPCETIFEQTEPSDFEDEEEPVAQGSTTPTTTPVGAVLQRIDDRRRNLFGAADLEEIAPQASMMVPSGSYSFENGSPLPVRTKELSMLKTSMGSRNVTGASLFDRGEEASTRVRQMTYPMDTPTRGEVSATNGKSVLSPSTLVTPWNRRRGRPYPRFEVEPLPSGSGTGTGPVEEVSAQCAETEEGREVSVVSVTEAGSVSIEGSAQPTEGTSPVRAVVGVETRQRSASEPETTMSRSREDRREQVEVVPEGPSPQDENLLVDRREETEIAYSRVYLDKLREEFRLAEERLDQARRNFLAGVKEFKQYEHGEVEVDLADESVPSAWLGWYCLAWLVAILIATYMFVMWNGQEVYLMDPFFISRPSGWQTWIMELFGGATSACRAGFDPACWVWNPSPQEMLLYSRRYAFTPI